MADRLTIIGKDGEERFVLDDRETVIKDMRDHAHEFDTNHVCTICGRNESEIEA